MWHKRVVHKRNLRLKVNAGVNFPDCLAGARLLDMDATGRPTTNEMSEVTCKKCLALVRNREVTL